MSKSMFMRWSACVMVVGLLLVGQASPDLLWAQGSCAEYDQSIRIAMANCTVVGTNESCYGNYTITPVYSDNDVGFNYPQALASVSKFTSLTTTDPGVVVMVLQPAAAANSVRLTLFGNAWAGTSAAPDSLTFGASGGTLCEGMYSGMVAYTPSGQKTQFTVNGVRIELASTAVITRRTNLTIGAAGGGSSRIVFSSDRAGNWDIYSMDMTGGNVVQLTRGGGQEVSPRLSPDGSQIVFTSAPEIDILGYDPNSEIYVMDSDGSNVRQLTNNQVADWQPGWSPDGRHIVFVSDRDDFSWHIYVMNSDGFGAQRLTTRWDDWPAWSPDGQQIVFVRSDSDGNTSLYVMDADGNNIRRLTYGAFDAYPSWSPDGSRIAFASDWGDSSGDLHVYIVSAEGGTPFRVTTQGDSWAPVWTPDGQQIVYQSYQDGDDYELFIINADGSNERRLTDNQYQDYDPHMAYGGGVSGSDVMTIANKEGTVQVNVAGQIYRLPVGDELHIELATQRPAVIGQNSNSPLIGYTPLDTIQQSLSAVQISSPPPAVSFEVREPTPCSFDLVNTSQNATSFTWQIVNVYNYEVTDVIQQPDLSRKLSPGDWIQVTLIGSGPGGTAASRPQEISCPLD